MKRQIVNTLLRPGVIAGLATAIGVFLVLFALPEGQTELETPPADTDEYSAKTTAYLDVVYQLVPGFADDDEQDVIGVGKAVCNWYDKGLKTPGLVDVLEGDMPRKEAHTLITVSVKTYCPEYMKTLKGN